MYPLPQAVIFDLDGTLLNTIDDLADSCNHVLTERGLPTHATKDYLYFVGNGIRTLAQRILPETSRDAAQIDDCMNRIACHYEQNWHTKTTIYPEITALLASLQEQGITLNVLSNKNERTVQNMVHHYFGDVPFRYIFGAVNSFKKKPDPARALHLAGKLGLDPDKIMFIGDSKVDMQTAENAGMVGVGVTWGFRLKQELMAHGCKICIDSPMDLWKEMA